MPSAVWTYDSISRESIISIEGLRLYASFNAPLVEENAPLGGKEGGAMMGEGEDAKTFSFLGCS